MPGRRSTSTARGPAVGGHRFGSHLSVAGGLHHAIEDALRLGFSCVQVFVKNQRQWAAAPLDPAHVDRWTALLATPGFGPAVAHATYLVNLASPDPALWEKSRAAFADELARCDQLGIPYLVVHPGSAVGGSREDAVRKVADALNRIFEDAPTLRVMPLLETTAGQGATLGRTFEELAEIIAGIDEPQRVGVCVDTCHVFAAGYDIRTPAGVAALLETAERCVGIERIRCWHLNDSRGDCGSRLDRHEHIGAGRIGRAGFAALLADARIGGVPMILETPKETDARGREWDAVNLALLRRLERGSGARR
ncbi:MAG: deoxyribonuclease IV [Phycisphaerales bacterium]|nr:deoxyribonuclease IV [Phycisphaerales bacterium]